MKRDLSYLLNQNLAVVPGITQAVAVSVDGLLLAKTDGLTSDAAERVAAVASGLNSLLSGAANELDAGNISVTLTEMDRGYLILIAVSTGASLLALATRDADIAYVTAEMAQFVDKVGDQLTPAFADHVTTIEAKPR